MAAFFEKYYEKTDLHQLLRPSCPCFSEFALERMLRDVVFWSILKIYSTPMRPAVMRTTAL